MSTDKDLRARLTDAALRRAEQATALAQAAAQLRDAQETHQQAAARYRAAVDEFDSLEDQIARGITIGRKLKP